MVVEDSPQNYNKCYCPMCSLYADCNKKAKQALFCVKGKSECPMDSKKICICGSCPVYAENNLSGGYFCLK